MIYYVKDGNFITIVVCELNAKIGTAVDVYCDFLCNLVDI